MRFHRLLVLLTLVNAMGCDLSSTTQPKSIIGSEDWSRISSSEARGVQRNVFVIEKDGQLLATGFALRPGVARLVTNAHVAAELRGCLESSDCIAMACNAWNTTRIQAIEIFDARLDFAVLKLAEPPQGVKTLTPARASVGEDVMAVGFLDRDILAISPGTVVALDIERRVTPGLHHTADTIPGMSGSPVVNAQGGVFRVQSTPRSGRCRPAKVLLCVALGVPLPPRKQ